MSKLFIRNHSCGYITFLHDKLELLNFIDYYIPGRVLVIGDLATFNTPMKQILLKFIESNPSVNCYSSEDICDKVLQSRFVEIIKEPIKYSSNHSVEDFKASKRDFLSSRLNLGALSYSRQLIAPSLNNQLLKLLTKYE